MRSFVLTLSLMTAASPVFGQQAPTLVAAEPAALTAAPALTHAEKVRFLESADITIVKAARKGIAGTQRATLSSDAVTHDASIQMIDLSKAQFQTKSRVELGFRDYWGFNVAAYRLGVMMGLDMIPPSVPRRFRSQDAAFTWWVDDVILDEQERVKQKREPPSPTRWAEQMHVLRVFDELIANTDRNQGNLLIDKHWKIWFIDHTRAFRTTSTLQAPSTIVRCDKALLDAMKTLSLPAMKVQLDDFLTQQQMEALLKRRDLLVNRLESLGTDAVFTLPAR
jgi:hypothetical protein